MSCIVIGDIHGRNLWKPIIKKHSEDLIVFVGDYFDSKEQILTEAQIQNFREILELKRRFAGRVTLLLGNHDYHYLPHANGSKYSGYQYFGATDIQEILYPAVQEGLLAVCKSMGTYLISHAGVTNSWCKKHEIPAEDPEEAINRLFTENPQAFDFSPGPLREPSGDEPEQGPFWVRPFSLKKDQIPGFIQIVGHTQAPGIDLDQSPVLIDVLGYSPKYLVIKDDGKLEVSAFC